ATEGSKERGGSGAERERVKRWTSTPPMPSAEIRSNPPCHTSTSTASDETSTAPSEPATMGSTLHPGIGSAQLSEKRVSGSGPAPSPDLGQPVAITAKGRHRSPRRRGKVGLRPKMPHLVRGLLHERGQDRVDHPDRQHHRADQQTEERRSGTGDPEGTGALGPVRAGQVLLEQADVLEVRLPRRIEHVAEEG